jgi:hypothetical protein
MFQIFRLIHRLNSKQTSDELFEAVKAHGISDDDFKAYLIYCSGYNKSLKANNSSYFQFSVLIHSVA